jgi:hypothetical protein
MWPELLSIKELIGLPQAPNLRHLQHQTNPVFKFRSQCNHKSDIQDPESSLTRDRLFQTTTSPFDDWAMSRSATV